MKKQIAILVGLIVLSVVSGCATARTKWTDKSMRVMVDPDSIPAEQYVVLQQALVESGKWFVVDRAMGFRAMKTEQERLHRTEEDRYEDKEKWSHWGKLYGVGGIVVAAVQCKRSQGFFGGWQQTCKQYLSIMDSNTGEVITAIEGENSSEAEFTPDWHESVAKLNSAYPSHFEGLKTSDRLEQYRALSAEEAQRQREKVAAKLAPVVEQVAPQPAIPAAPPAAPEAPAQPAAPVVQQPAAPAQPVPAQPATAAVQPKLEQAHAIAKEEVQHSK